MARMKIAYFDCFSGISGDMALGALLACDGADEALFRAQLAGLKVPGYDLIVSRVKREGIAATDVTVRLIEKDQGHGRHLADIAKILQSSDLAGRVKERTLAIFTRLADAEAKIHGVDREEIHFHEVGAVDAIVDIVGSCILLEMLGVDQVSVSALPCGHGTITCQHGIMPIPAPATLELLKGFPVRSVDIEGELVTPTGAAIVATLADPQSAGHMPDMRIVTTGFGAGKKQFKKDMPNLLRVIVGASEKSATIGERQRVCVIETNLDDERPETLGYLMERCLAAGAWDIFFTPITMKKSRPGVMVTVLCPPDLVDATAAILFRETGTFGLRVREQDRLILLREWRTVATPYGEIRLKIGSWQGEVLSVSPEYEDCRAAAELHKVPLNDVYQAALAADRL
jgi:uncharacterized protein (TIGR00299 family) protein